MNLLKYSLRNLFKNNDQNRNKEFIEKYFQNKKGTYVDVGSYHPIRISNTLNLHKNGWSGTVSYTHLTLPTIYSV